MVPICVHQGNISTTTVMLEPTTEGAKSGNISQTAVTLEPTTDAKSGNISTTTVIPETTTTEGKLLNGASLYSSR